MQVDWQGQSGVNRDTNELVFSQPPLLKATGDTVVLSEKKSVA